MGREHLLTDNPEAIAFGRARLSALRAAGKRYVTQVFDTPFGRVKVRIVGGVEYISAETDLAGYLVLPHSLLHPEGVTVDKDGDSAPPQALLRLRDEDLKVREHVGYGAGAHDWVSEDGKQALSYDHGYERRYRPEIGPAQRAEPWFFRRGTQYLTSHNVVGAGMFGKRVVYVSYPRPDDPRVLRVYEYKSDGADLLIGEYVVPSGRVVSQPAFFGGSGRKFVTTVRDNAGWLPLYGDIALGDDGELRATFTAGSIEVPSSAWKTERDFDPPESQPITYTMSFVNPGPHQSWYYSSIESVQHSDSHDNRKSALAEWAFFDLGAADQLLIGASRQFALENESLRMQSSTALQQEGRSVAPTNPGEAPGAEFRWAQSGSNSSEGAEDHYSGTEWSLNGALSLPISDSGYSVASVASSNLSFPMSGWLPTAVEWLRTVGDGGDYTAQRATTTTERVTAFSLMDIDLRYTAALGTRWTRFRTKTDTSSNGTSTPGTYTPYLDKVELVAYFNGHTYTRVLGAGQAHAPTEAVARELHQLSHPRAMASRKEDEHVISTRPWTSERAAGLADLLGFPVDNGPFNVAYRRGKTFQDFSGFSISGNAEFRFPPVKVL